MSAPIRWAPQWRSRNRAGHFVWEFEQPMLFRTRAECRAWIDEHYGYIRTRADLRAEPHGWRMPRAVKVRVVLEAAT